MGVAQRHGERGMPEEILDLDERPAALHPPGGVGVPQIVELEVLDPRHTQRALPCAPVTVPPTCPADGLAGSRAPSNYRLNLTRLRDRAALPRLRDLHLDDAAGTVHAVPRQAQNLGLAGAGVQRHGDDVEQVRIPGLRARSE